MVFRDIISIESEGGFDSFNITDRTRKIVSDSKIQEGIAVLFFQHTTGAIMVIEHETGILLDIQKALETITPADGEYFHHLRGYDINGCGHVRNALMSSSVTIPIINSDLALGDYQEIIVIDMQPDPCIRNVIVQIIGE
jgi:secondary thiamine-phosphate synthase enzyme